MLTPEEKQSGGRADEDVFLEIVYLSILCLSFLLWFRSRSFF